MVMEDPDFSCISKAIQAKDDKIKQLNQSLSELKAEFESNWSIIEKQELQFQSLKSQIEEAKEALEDAKQENRKKLTEIENISNLQSQNEEKDNQIISNIHELESYAMNHKFNLSKIKVGDIPNPQLLDIKNTVSELETVYQQILIRKQTIYSQVEKEANEVTQRLKTVSSQNEEEIENIDKEIFHLEFQKNQFFEALKTIEDERKGALKVCQDEENRVFQSSPIIRETFESIQDLMPKLLSVSGQIDNLESEVKERREEVSSLQKAAQKAEEASNFFNSDSLQQTQNIQRQIQMIEMNNQKLLKDITYLEKQKSDKDEEINDFIKFQKDHENQTLLLERLKLVERDHLKKIADKHNQKQKCILKQENEFRKREPNIQERLPKLEEVISKNTSSKERLDEKIHELNEKIQKYTEIAQHFNGLKEKIDKEIHEKENDLKNKSYQTKLHELQEQLAGISLAIRSYQSEKEKREDEINGLKEENIHLQEELKYFSKTKKAYNLLLQEIKKRK